MNIRDELESLAGLTKGQIVKGKEDKNFDLILQVLSSIHKGKEVLYGSYLESHGNEPPTFCVIQHFCDIKRKYVRAENFVRLRSEGSENANNLLDLLDTYSDMAVYSVLGIQLIQLMIEKEEKGVKNGKNYNKL